MKEEPFTPPISHMEVAVRDPNLFLLRRANRAFVEQRSMIAYLEDTLTAGWRTMGMVLIGGGGAVLWAFEITTPLGVLALFGWAWLISLVFYGQASRHLWVKHNTDGWILAGKVLYSKKIPIRKRNFVYQQIGVQYAFLAPDGETREGYSAADSAVANSIIAPLPGTPLRVWYTHDGKYYLL